MMVLESLSVLWLRKGVKNMDDGVQNNAEISARLQVDVHGLNFHTSWNCEKGFYSDSVDWMTDQIYSTDNLKSTWQFDIQ